MREASGPEVFAKYGLNPVEPKVLDNSTSSEINNCRREGYYRYILGRVPEERAHGLRFGSTWHAMHEAHGHGRDKATVERIADLMLPEAIDDKYNRTRSRIKEAFEKWQEVYATDENIIKVERIEDAAEIFCPPDAECFLRGCNLWWSGKMDRLIRIYGRLWILDFKTSTQEDFYYQDKIVLDHQLRGYAWLLSHLMGERVWGVMVDRAVINSSKINFTRYQCAISDGHLMSFVRNQQEMYAEIKWRFQRGAYDLNTWPENPNECFRFGRCTYHGVCSTSPWPDTEARLKVLSSDFVEARHNVFALGNKEPGKEEINALIHGNKESDGSQPGTTP